MKVTGNTSSKVVEGLNEIGGKASEGARRVRVFFADKKDAFVKSDLYKKVSPNVNKKTALGAGIVVAGLVLAFKCIKGVINKVSEIRK